MYFSPILDEGIFKNHALGHKEGESGSLVRHHEEAKLAAEFSVVAFFRLFQTLEVLIELGFFWEGCSVDPLQHLAV